MFGHYIPASSLQTLHRYKYSSGGSTPVDRLMNIYWEAVAARLPPHIHPNIVTLLAVFCSLLAVLLQLYFSPTLSEPAPQWVYFAVAVLFFLQQTFDAVDGKHARKNNLSSPLGQLFDHGCDILIVTPMTLVSMAILTAGTGLASYAVAFCSSQLLQFIYMWWELHFHVFYTCTGFIGVTEAQLGVISVALISALFGPEVWRSNALNVLPKSTFRDVLSTVQSTLHIEFNGMLFIQAILVICNLWAVIYDIVAGLKRAPKRLLAATQLSSFLLYMVLQGALWYICLETPYRKYTSPALVYFSISTSYSILLLRLCLSATCRSSFKLVHKPMLPFFFATLSVIAFPWCRMHLHMLLAGVSICNVIYLSDFLYTSVNDVCNCLGISCFRVNNSRSQTGKQQKVNEMKLADVTNRKALAFRNEERSNARAVHSCIETCQTEAPARRLKA